MTTVWADYGFLFLVGLVFGVFTSRQCRKSGTLFRNRYFLAALLFQSVFCMPLAVYCYAIFPDWCWMYWLEASEVPPAWVFLAFGCYYLFMAAGFGIGAKSADTKGQQAGLRLLGYSLAVLLLLLAVFSRRLVFVGTLAEFQAGTARPLFSHQPLFPLLLAGFALALLVMALLLLRFGKELDHRWSKEDQQRLSGRRRVVSSTRVGSRNIKDALEASLSHWGGKEYLRDLLRRKGPRVLLKPNLAGGAKGHPGTQTSAKVLGAVIDLVRDIAPEAQILVVESGSIFWWDLGQLCRGSPHERLLLEKDVRLVDLSREPLREYDFGGRMGKEPIPALFLEPHVLIDIPVAKTHGYFKITGAVKNLFGLTPAVHKLFRYHLKGFADRQGQIFLDLYRHLTPDLVVVDATTSIEGDGPLGRPKETGVLITSDDALCADFLLAEIMGYRPQEIPYLAALFRQEGFSLECERLGDPLSTVRPEHWAKPSWGALSLLKNLGRIVYYHSRPERSL
jgi:uncharacterized protein (DUF362 family)